jgi:tRNA pseudouridine55 synthase
MTTVSTSPSGILIINKPAGWTSHDVVNRIRRIYHTKKVGHAGTLDPMATGVLLLLVGAATKLSDQLLSQDKTYQAEITFGQQTDTGDADGQIIDTDDATWLTADQVTKILPLLIGSRPQTVPAYSAVKVNGQKLYNLARSGQPVTDRPTRDITIRQLELNDFDSTPPFPRATITVDCSKGTYIRVLAEEVADKLGTVAHLTALTRLASGQFQLEQAVTLEQLQQLTDPTTALLPLDRYVNKY